SSISAAKRCRCWRPSIRPISCASRPTSGSPGATFCRYGAGSMPVEPADLLVFLTAALMLNLTPGNDMMYVLGQGLKGGPRTGIAASLGIATGSLIHLILVALGVAVVLAEHPQIFDAIRWAGALYLVWIAFKALTTPIAAIE